MSKDWQEVQDIFDQISNLDPEDRDPVLREVCKGRDDIYREVSSLLQYHDEDGSFLQDSAVDRVSEALDMKTGRKKGPIPKEVGHYKILEQIGRGSMGAVYRALQIKPVKREVALKIINTGVSNEGFLSRFRYEHQALAMMNHTNIASVYDAGSTADDLPYFTMELIHGSPITQWCDDHHHSIRDRLKLFTQVCEGVRHAHQKGLIHRDLKPSNILVTDEGGKPVPKIIDFGIAKDIGTSGEATLYGVMLGTPAYMSPEQALGETLDTATDVYGLGTILYKLLTGFHPFDSSIYEDPSPPRVLTHIIEADPPKPSERFKQATLKCDPGANPAEARQISPKKLLTILQGELDWIILKAVAKDRDQRYGSPQELAADIQRYLDEKPIEARPPSLGYRIRKFTRRNKLSVVASVLLGIGLLGASLALLNHFKANQAKEMAAQLQTMLDKTLSVNVWDPLPPEENLKNVYQVVADFLEDSKVPISDDTRMYMSGMVGSGFSSLDEYERADGFLSGAYELAIKNDKLTAPKIRDILNHHAWNAIKLNDTGKAEEALNRIVKVHPDDNDTDVPSFYRAHLLLGEVYLIRREFKQAETALEQAHQLTKSHRNLLNRETIFHGEILRLKTLTSLRKMNPALIMIDQMEKEIESEGSTIQNRIYFYQTSAITYMGQGDYDQAREHNQLAIDASINYRGKRSPHTLQLKYNHALILNRMGDRSAAIAMLSGNLSDYALLKKSSYVLTQIGAHSNEIAHILLIIADEMEPGDDKSTVIDLIERLKRDEILNQPERPSFQDYYHRVTLGEIFLEQGRFQEAADFFHLIAYNMNELEPGHHQTALAESWYGYALTKIGELEMAKSCLIAGQTGSRINNRVFLFEKELEDLQKLTEQKSSFNRDATVD